MNESACLCGSVGSLLTPSAISAFVPEIAAPHGFAWLRNKSFMRDRKSNRDKALCIDCGSEQKDSPVIGVFTLRMQALLWVTRAAQNIYVRLQEAEVNWSEIIFLWNLSLHRRETGSQMEL